MASTATSEVSEGPVLSLITKRLRALRKKLNRITQMEESLSQGKSLNKEQQEVLRTKPSITSSIDELEKLRQPLTLALNEELTLALTTNHNHNHNHPNDSDSVEDLLSLVYFGSLFDARARGGFGSMCLVRAHERECCLSYDYVADEEGATDLLREEDLDSISRLSGMLVSRPDDSSLSHRDALRRCVEHARAWLADSDTPIDHNDNVTYRKLKERLRRIMGSNYFTTSPEIKPPALQMAAAAAAANYVPVQVSGVAVPVQVEGLAGEYQQKDDETATLQEQETGGSHSSSVQEHQKDEQETEIPPQDIPAQHEQVNQEAVEAEHNQRELDSKDQQYVPRRGGYQNQRGRGGRGGGSGGHRGYSNGRGGRSGGRGGGPYQNGRGQQYDQPGNYYPVDYQNNRGGRGGRGRGGGGYNHRGPSAQGGHNPSDVGVGA